MKSQKCRTFKNNHRLSTQKIASFYRQKKALIFSLLSLSFAIIYFLIKVKTGLKLFEFGDETEKFVVVKMIAQGQHLYRDVFSHHGPIMYMIAHLYAIIISISDYSLARLAVAAIAVVSCFSLAFSPALKDNAQRAWVAVLYLMLLSFVWIMQGMHMLLYHHIGGFFFVIAFSQMVVPALLGVEIGKYSLFFSGFSLVIACFSAYAFGPAAVLFVASAVVSQMASYANLKTYCHNFFAGVICATVIVLTWLIVFGDLLGYIVYHFYFNQKVYSSYIGFTPFSAFNLRFYYERHDIIKTLSLLFLFIWTYIIAFVVLRKAIKTKAFLLYKSTAIILMFMAVLLVNPRGGNGFHSAGFVVVNFAAISLMLTMLLEKPLKSFEWKSMVHIFALFLTLFFITKQVSDNATTSPHGIAARDITNFVHKPKPERIGIYNFVQNMTDQKDNVLSLVFNPIFYIKSDRMPASGHFYYLPWQAAYNRVSVLDFKIDICKDIESNQPAVIWFDNWKVWDRYEISIYEPCVPELIKANYTLYDDHAMFLRNDLAENIRMSKSSED